MRHPGHIPFLYMERAKRPHRGYLRKVVIGDDFLLLLLGIGLLSPYPLAAASMLASFHLSFWCIYEAGYVDNDIQGAAHETAPHLHPGWETYRQRFSFVAAWIWGLLSALPGIGLYALIGQWEGRDVDLLHLTALYLAWIGVLLLLWATYWWFNRLDKQTRVWPYLLLQWLKCFPFLLLSPGNWLTASLFTAQVMARWFAYFLHRFSDRGWPKVVGGIRPLLFLALSPAFGWIAGGLPWPHRPLEWLQLALILGFLWFRGRHQLREIGRRARRLDR